VLRLLRFPIERSGKPTSHVFGCYGSPRRRYAQKVLPIAAILLAVTLPTPAMNPQTADPKTYLAAIQKDLAVEWPANHTINVVCHGHSVPAGYFLTPKVDTFNAYPHLLHVGIKERFPLAVVNVIVTAIGGEQSEQGAARFENDVLSLNPAVVTIDYALNDRGIGLERAKTAWTSMIRKAKAKGVKVILLTPTGDLSSNLDDENDPLNQHARQIRALAAEHGVGLVDSLAAFRAYVKAGHKLDDLMSQVNHPNRKGHDIVAKLLMEWFGTKAHEE
jgi:lysophospholipase L1-like esterase